MTSFFPTTTNPPSLTGELAAVIEADRKALMGDFCRGCGYCLPCPAGIDISHRSPDVPDDPSGSGVGLSQRSLEKRDGKDRRLHPLRRL
jgi:hypothetical protein